MVSMFFSSLQTQQRGVSIHDTIKSATLSSGSTNINEDNKRGSFSLAAKGTCRRVQQPMYLLSCDDEVLDRFLTMLAGKMLCSSIRG